MNHLTSLAFFVLVVFLFSVASARLVPKYKSYGFTYEEYENCPKEVCESKAPLVCNFVPTDNSTVYGKVLFTPAYSSNKCHVRVQAYVSGLGTDMLQGMHIHKHGDLSQTNGKSLGGHFTNPQLTEVAHGYSNSPQRHWGDLGNLVVDKDGNSRFDQIDNVITLEGILGRGMVVHAGRDKGPESQPSGGAGARKAMCVIGFANPELM